MKNLALAVIAVALPIACGGTSASSAGTPASTHSAAAGGSAAAGKDACTVVPQSRISSAVGFTFITTSSTSMNGTEICQYIGTNGGSLSVDRFPAGETVETVAKVQFGTHSTQQVSGVGDRAVYSFASTAAGPDAELIAQKGQKVVLVILFQQGLTADQGQKLCSAVADVELSV